VYENPLRGKQLLRFDGMRFLDTITPTDIDGLIEVRGQVLVLFEAKLAGKDVPHGQRVALEQIVQDARRAGKHAVALVVEHSITDPAQDVILKDLAVREAYRTETLKWQEPRTAINAKQAAELYIRHFYRVA
jgi:hypothetical protein